MPTYSQILSEIRDPEHIVPGKTPVYLFQKHAARYQFVSELIRGKSVLDLGCGDGYGAYYLAQYAKQVVGIDIATNTVATAHVRYRRQNLSFVPMNGENLAFPSTCFDVLCAFESIEHLVTVDNFLAESCRVLKPEGLFVVSTPNINSYVAAGHNPWHTREYTYQEFYELLQRYFASVEVWGQFCQKPLREWLYRRSSSLYFSSRLFRYCMLFLGTLYLYYIGEQKNRYKIDWVDSTRTSLFTFRSDNAEDADSFLALCKRYR